MNQKKDQIDKNAERKSMAQVQSNPVPTNKDSLMLKGMKCNEIDTNFINNMQMFLCFECSYFVDIK